MHNSVQNSGIVTHSMIVIGIAQHQNTFIGYFGFLKFKSTCPYASQKRNGTERILCMTWLIFTAINSNDLLNEFSNTKLL